MGGAAHMASCAGGSTTGQRWKSVPVGGGWFRLQNVNYAPTMTEDLFLEAPDGLDGSDSLGGAARLAPLADNDRQLWRLLGTRSDGKASTGAQAWTLFIGAENFNGPVAFFVPDVWSALSQGANGDAIIGRGLDNRPAQVVSGVSMEINTVPYFQATSTTGDVYTRIPQLAFPVDPAGSSILMADITFYPVDTISDPFNQWRHGATAPTNGFLPNTGVSAVVTPSTPAFRQGPSGADLPVLGIDTYFATRAATDGSFWLDWKNGNTALPDYFRHDPNGAQPITAADVPADTQLTAQQFQVKTPSGPIVAPTGSSPRWNTPGTRKQRPALGRIDPHLPLVQVHRSALAGPPRHRVEPGQTRPATTRRRTVPPTMDPTPISRRAHPRDTGPPRQRPASNTATGLRDRLRPDRHTTTLKPRASCDGSCSRCGTRRCRR